MKIDDWIFKWETYWYLFMGILILVVLSSGGIFTALTLGAFVVLASFTLWGIAGADTRDARDDIWNFAKKKDDTKK